MQPRNDFSELLSYQHKQADVFRERENDRIARQILRAQRRGAPQRRIVRLLTVVRHMIMLPLRLITRAQMSKPENYAPHSQKELAAKMTD